MPDRTNRVSTTAAPVSARLFERRDAVANCEFHQRGQVIKAQLLHESQTVGLHGAGRQSEGRRRFGIALAFGDKPDHVALAGGEVLHDNGSAQDAALDQRVRNAVPKEALACDHSPDRLDHIVARGLLEQTMKCMVHMPLPIASTPTANEIHCLWGCCDGATRIARTSATNDAMVATMIDSRTSQ